jgi:hypothetical protein
MPSPSGRCVNGGIIQLPSIYLVVNSYELDLSSMEPLLSSEPSTALGRDKSPMRRVKTRPGRPKPSDIFVHPAESNLARADAAAVELGLHGSTERVSAQPESEPERWQAGKGRDVARGMLGLSRSADGSHRRSPSQQELFRVDSNSDED